MAKKKTTPQEKKSELKQEIIDIARVTRVMAGGKRMSFRACVVVGDDQHRIGYGVAKGADVAAAVQKATRQAEKSMFQVPLKNETIPHSVFEKFGAARIMIKPAPKGTGVKAGGAVRVVLELAGVPNVVAKIMGTRNKINNVKATYEALRKLKAD